MIERLTEQREAAQAIDDIDGQIKALNEDKKAIYASMKEALAPSQNKAWREAVKLRQKRRDLVKRTEMEDHDALVWETLQALEAPVLKPKKKSGTEVATRVHDAREEPTDDGRAVRDEIFAKAGFARTVDADGEVIYAKSMVVEAPPHDPDTGEIQDTENRPQQVAPQPGTDGAAGDLGAVNQLSPAASNPETPPVDPPVPIGEAGQAEGVNPQSAPSADADDDLALPMLDRPSDIEAALATFSQEHPDAVAA
jgi:hypothetical protein